MGKGGMASICRFQTQRTGQGLRIKTARLQNPYIYFLLNLLMLQSSCTAKPCLRIQRKKWYNGQPQPPIIQYIKT